MTHLTAAQITKIDGLTISLAEITLPAFQDGEGYWSNYEALAEAGISEITVRPEIVARALDDSSLYIDLNCYFDPEVFNTDTYGLVYGDPTFERAMSNHIKAALGLTGEDVHFQYTEQGMQGDDMISMEASAGARQALAGISNHALIALTLNPAVIYIDKPGFSWERDPEGSVSAS